MDPTKTRIWQAQNLGLAAQSGSAAQLAQARPGENTPQPQRSSRPPPPPTSQQPRRSSVPPPPPPSSTHPGAAPWRPLAATRIMPIEQLFPSAQPAHSVARQNTPRASMSEAAPSWRMLKRIAVHVSLGTLTLLAVAAWKLPRARLMPLQPAAVIEEAQEIPRVKKATDPELAAQPTVALATRAAEKSKPQSERRAIELVIAGDYLAAAQAYRALASEQPDSAVFREAARILAARQLPLRAGK